jgi:hypothetical protein
MILTLWIVELKSIHHVLLGALMKKYLWHAKDMGLPFFMSHF